MQRRFEINDPKLEQARNAVAAWRARRARLGPMPERRWRPSGFTPPDNHPDTGGKEHKASVMLNQ